MREGAEEGKDYTLDRLLPFWENTSVQDWKLCEDNQLGVESSRYEPGILSSTKEQGYAPELALLAKGLYG